MSPESRQEKKALPSVLLLSSRDGTHTGPSGYSALSNHLPAATFLEVNRKSPKNLCERILTAINRRLTLSPLAWGPSLKLEWMAWQTLKKKPHQIVHYLWADRDLAYLDLLKPYLGCKIMGTFHTCPDQIERLFNFLGRARAVDHFIVVSSCQVKEMEKLGIPASKISVVLHGVNTRHFTPDPARRTKKFRVLSVGNTRRDFACTESVMRSLAGKDGLECVALVPQVWRERWKSIPSLNLPERLNDQELLHLYQSADVLLMAAEAATANNALVEALSCGLPIVCSETGGLREYATDQAALFFRPGDAQEAVQNILHIKRTPTLAASLSSGARKRAKELDWRLIADQIKEKYNMVAASSGGTTKEKKP